MPSNGRPATRGQIERLMEIARLLRAGRHSAGSMAERLECSERTVRRDLEFARDRLRWPVEYDASAKVWRLHGPPGWLPAMPMTGGELMAIHLAGRVMEAYRGTPYAAALQSAFDRLLAVLDNPITQTLPITDALPHFQLDPTRELDPGLYDRLTRACAAHRRLALTYRTLSRGETTRRLVDPYRLVNHMGDWYLVAHCHLRGGIRDFAVSDRMQSVEETGETFDPDPGFDLAAYLSDGFGIFKGGPVEEVALRFTAAQAPYIRERTWHETQSLEEEDDGRVILRMRVPVNIGIVRFVLQHGSSVEVLAPPSLRDRVAEELKEALGRYGLVGLWARY